MRGMNRDEKIALFWSRIDRSGGPDACWPWTRSIFTATGYGQVTGLESATKPTTAHRLAWVLTFGDPGEYVHPRSGRAHRRKVMHRCPDGPNRLCCNPSHLAIGTDQDNADDRARDGNQARGERTGGAKLTSDLVCEARRLRGDGWSWVDLANRYGVAVSTIRPAVDGRTWAHVTCTDRKS